MRLVLPAVLMAGLALPGPAMAADPEAGAAELADKLSDPVRQERIATAAEAVTEAMLAMPVAPLLRAAAIMAGEDPEAVDSDLRVGDVAGPEAEEMPRQFAERVPQMMGAMASLAVALEQMMPEFRELGRRLEDAMPRDDEARY